MTDTTPDPCELCLLHGSPEPAVATITAPPECVGNAPGSPLIPICAECAEAAGLVIHTDRYGTHTAHLPPRAPAPFEQPF